MRYPLWAKILSIASLLLLSGLGLLHLLDLIGYISGADGVYGQEQAVAAARLRFNLIGGIWLFCEALALILITAWFKLDDVLSPALRWFGRGLVAVTIAGSGTVASMFFVYFLIAIFRAR